jgi:hypothetical protein
MAFKTVDPEFLTQLRRAEVAKLKFAVSFPRVFAREIVSPTYKYEWNRLDDAVVVSRSKTGKAGQRSVFGQDRTSTDMQFYIAEADFPWADRWMADNRLDGTLPIPINSPVDELRAGRIMVEDILRDMDTDVYDTVIALDGSPSSIGANPVSTVEGREAFLETVATVIKEAGETYVTGEKVLAIDQGAMGFLGMPFAYSDGTGTATGAGPSVLEMVRGMGVRVEAVENPTLNGKAILHYREADNFAYLHSTPNGVYAAWGEPGDNRTLRVLHHMGKAEMRENDVNKHVSVLTGLF